MFALDIDQLRSFVAIAETGSYTRAAHLVHRTQSAVSMQMRRLEEILQRPLFVRDGRNSRLSSDGQRFLEYAGRIISLNDETFRAFALQKLEGRLCLGLPDDYADRLLPKVLASFRRVHPAAEIMVECHASSTVSEKVSNGILDIGIVTHGDLEGTMVKETIIRREPVFWVAGNDYPLNEDRPLSLAVGLESCVWRRSALKALHEQGRAYHIDYVSSSGAALVGAVMSGLAITVLPESTMRPSLRVLTERDGFLTLPDCEISMIRSSSAAGPLVDALAQHILASVGNMRDMAVGAA